VVINRHKFGEVNSTERSRRSARNSEPMAGQSCEQIILGLFEILDNSASALSLEPGGLLRCLKVVCGSIAVVSDTEDLSKPLNSANLYLTKFSVALPGLHASLVSLRQPSQHQPVQRK